MVAGGSLAGQQVGKRLQDPSPLVDIQNNLAHLHQGGLGLKTAAERQVEGILKAKQRGVKFGRRKTLTPAQIAELQQRREQGVTIKTLMADYRLSKSSVYLYLGLDHLKSEVLRG
jgi:hypothetical protein